MKVIYFQYLLREVLLNLLSYDFSTKEQDDISYESNDMQVRLIRARDDRMTIEFNISSMDYICSIVIFNNTSVFNIRTGFTLNTNENDILYSSYSSEYNNSIVIKKIIRIQLFETCELNYPLQGDQLFQMMTIFPVPETHNLDLFMGTCSYAMNNSVYKGYSFHINKAWLYTINETNEENVVQSMMDAVIGLIDIEKSRNSEV